MHEQVPGSLRLPAAFVSLSNAFVAILQLYWATLIFAGLQKMLVGGGGGGGAKGGKKLS